MRPNERFSGRGHARHMCKGCAKLGQDELAYRQGVRDIERLLGGRMRIPRKQRKSFERFLSHPNERIRKLAEEVARYDAEERAAFRRMLLAEEAEAQAALLAEDEALERWELMVAQGNNLPPTDDGTDPVSPPSADKSDENGSPRIDDDDAAAADIPF